MRRIGLLTSDFGLYHDLVRLLRERKVSFCTLAFGEVPEASVGVVLTSWRDALGSGLPRQIPVVAVSVDQSGREDLEGALAQALRILEGIETYGELVIGIDPGSRPGLAVLANGRLVHATQAFAVKDVALLVRSFLEQFPHEQALVRMGSGAAESRDRILADLKTLEEEGLRFELVDEWGTTPPTGSVDRPSDVEAAIRIARTPGRRLVFRDVKKSRNSLASKPQSFPSTSRKRGRKSRKTSEDG